MVRHSLNYVSWKMRKDVAADLKRIYSCATADEAEQMLGEFEDKWDDAYLPISQSWRRNWPRITPFFDYPPEIRKVIYTTNAIESVNMSLRKITKNRGSFPSDEALMKLFYLALRNISQKWTMPGVDGHHHWPTGPIADVRQGELAGVDRHRLISAIHPPLHHGQGVLMEHR